MSGLSAKQHRAIAALLVESTITEAARVVGTSEATLRRWLATPAFALAYRTARHRILESTLTSLQHATQEAVRTLVSIQKDALAPPAAKVSAARAVLEYAFKARETLEVEERLRALEAAQPKKP